MSFTTRLTDNRSREDIFCFYLCIHVVSGILDTCTCMSQADEKARVNSTNTSLNDPQPNHLPNQSPNFPLYIRGLRPILHDNEDH